MEEMAALPRFFKTLTKTLIELTEMLPSVDMCIVWNKR
jgi:hypothetical protein